MGIVHFRATLLIAVLVVFGSFHTYAQKMDPAEIIAKHRESIGTPEALAAVKNRLVLTDAQFSFKGGANIISGKALILSSGYKHLWGMKFASNDYPTDRFGFDGKDARVGRVTPTSRSLIGEFLYTNRVILRDGILGGSLSTTWPLLSPDIRGAKIEFAGSKKISGKDTWILSYSPKGGSDLTIKFYFDSKTYQHLRTEYVLVRAAAQGSTVDNSAGQSGATYQLVEEFSKFTKMGQLVLPGAYKITYSRSGSNASASAQNTNRDAEWTFSVTDYGINRELDNKSFEIEGK